MRNSNFVLLRQRLPEPPHDLSCQAPVGLFVSTVAPYMYDTAYRDWLVAVFIGPIFDGAIADPHKFGVHIERVPKWFHS